MSTLLNQAPRFSSSSALLRHYSQVRERMRSLAPPPVAALPSPDMMARGNPSLVPVEPTPEPSRSVATDLGESHDVCDLVPNQLSVPARELRVLDANAERIATTRAVRSYLRAVSNPPFNGKLATLHRCVATAFKIDRANLFGPARTLGIVRIRQIAMCLAGEIVGASLQEIGRSLGGRDHTTILHGQKRRQALVDEVLVEIPHARVKGHHRFKRIR